jgi:hypothetical protein
MFSRGWFSFVMAVKLKKRKDTVMKLEFVPKGISRKDATVVIRELRQIEASDGLITPRAVVQRAKTTKSPLHKFFEWDNDKAADKYREHQARALICSVYVRNAETEDAPNVRAFVNIKAEEEGSETSLQGYVGMQTALANPSMQQHILDYARNQLVMWRLKFGHLQAFLGVTNEIDKVVPPKKKAA